MPTVALSLFDVPDKMLRVPEVDGDDLSLDDLSPEEREKAEEIVREMAAVQEEVANTAPEVFLSEQNGLGRDSRKTGTLLRKESLKLRPAQI